MTRRVVQGTGQVVRAAAGAVAAKVKDAVGAATAGAASKAAARGGDRFGLTAKAIEAQRVHEPIRVNVGATGLVDLQQVKPGDFTSLSGTVVNKDPLKINNDGPPGGAYLKLDRPVLLAAEDGKKYEVRELFISLDQVTQSSCGTRGNNCGSCAVSDSCQVGKKLPDDRKLTVFGQLGTFAFGGEGQGKAPGFVVGIGGISVQGKDKKEPLYREDQAFHDPETDARLETLKIQNPVIANPTVSTPPGYRHPDAQLVFAKEPTKTQPDRVVVWVGKSGGGNNFLGDFHGFSGFHVPRAPTADEKARLKFQDQGVGAAGDFTAASTPRVRHGKQWLDTEAIGIAQGQTWFLDRKGDALYGAVMKPSPQSGFELTSVIHFAKDDIINGEAAPPVHGFFLNPDGTRPVDGRELGLGPRDELSKEKAKQPVWIARRVDPEKVDGPGGWFTNFIGPEAKSPEVASYGALKEVAGKDGLVSPDDFKKKLREIAETMPGGHDVVKQIEAVMAEAEVEYRAGRAAEPPSDKTAWFDFLLDSYMHAHDLRIWMKGLGFASEGTSTHDLTEMVPLKDVEWQMKGRYTEPWFERYVAHEKEKGHAAGLSDDEIMLNCSFLNPNYAAAGYMWGFAALGANDIMNLHRLSCHHSGNTHEEIYWVEKAMNFMIHHVPLEDFGVRHEEAGMFTRLVAEGVIQKSELDPQNLSEEKMFGLLEKALLYAQDTDKAMKTSEVGKAIIHDAFKVWRELAARGYVQPWQLARPRVSSGEYPLTPKLEASYRQLQLQTRAAKEMFDGAARAVAAAPADASPEVVAKAAGLVSSVKALRDGLGTAQVDSKRECEALVKEKLSAFRAVRAAAGDAPSSLDAQVVDAAAHATLAAFGLLAVFNEQAAVAFTEPMAELQASLLAPPPQNAPETFLSKDDLLRAIDEMKRVPEKASLAASRGDHTVSKQIEDIYRYWKNGFLLTDGLDPKLATAAL
ncbi:MAG: hypothetical protein IPJ65_35235 [Archangiaceae bacterium]|nr:hypothetical protein [Archangiaceae bacterium]